MKKNSLIGAAVAFVCLTANASDNRPAIGLAADMTASRISIYYDKKCGIEEVVVEVPYALGGREDSERGYLHVCYWVEGDNAIVVTQTGRRRKIPNSKFYPIKD